MTLARLLELRERVLTPGHPGRPVVWPYDDASATHLGLFEGGHLVGCASLTPQETPQELGGRPASAPFHLHSMAVEPAHQGRGLGRGLLTAVVAKARARGADLVWATARPSAVAFYERCGFEAGDELRIEPTNAPMRYIWRTLVPRH